MARDGGIKRFQQRMQAMPAAVRKAVGPAAYRGAEEIADMAETLAPEDSGDLKGSIVVTGPGNMTPPYSHPGGAHRVPEGAAAVSVGTSDVRYPHLQEFGTRHHPAQPFFWPAFRMLRKRSANRIKRAMSKAVKDNWGAGK
ncbi:HK97-gp10 family putative phage morphogenesis protein [Alkalilacustris brevis]|uniref:HK97-gp10 family putative phage morphogenesis protein n=1 Tax=Alkalilacustris brevis TaxID=2026338 RepID=UPI00192E47DA|nr:HK97-gp10 family putative phage morphogenesis protein [Alkalilacustris brevis]